MPERKPGLDALIDVLAPIAVEAPVSGDAALAALPPRGAPAASRSPSKGRTRPRRQWETPRSGQRYGAFQAGVQMANRTGALNEIEYSEFVVKAQAFADAVNGSPEFPEMLRRGGARPRAGPVRRRHDAQLGFTLRARNAAWSPGYVQQNAAGWASCRASSRAAWCCPRHAGPAADPGAVVRHPGRAVGRPGAVGHPRGDPQPGRAAGAPRRAALRAHARRRRSRWPRPWTAPSPTTTAR
jgi:hypothetical protein